MSTVIFKNSITIFWIAIISRKVSHTNRLTATATRRDSTCSLWSQWIGDAESWIAMRRKVSHTKRLCATEPLATIALRRVAWCVVGLTQSVPGEGSLDPCDSYVYELCAEWFASPVNDSTFVLSKRYDVMWYRKHTNAKLFFIVYVYAMFIQLTCHVTAIRVATTARAWTQPMTASISATALLNMAEPNA